MHTLQKTTAPDGTLSQLVELLTTARVLLQDGLKGTAALALHKLSRESAVVAEIFGNASLAETTAGIGVAITILPAHGREEQHHIVTVGEVS